MSKVWDWCEKHKIPDWGTVSLSDFRKEKPETRGGSTATLYPAETPWMKVRFMSMWIGGYRHTFMIYPKPLTRRVSLDVLTGSFSSRPENQTP